MFIALCYQYRFVKNHLKWPLYIFVPVAAVSTIRHHTAKTTSCHLTRFSSFSLFSLAAQWMRYFNARGATDVTGYGLLGAATSLAKEQQQDVNFVIHNLPVISKMAAVNKVVGNAFNLTLGLSPETSGLFCFCSTVSWMCVCKRGSKTSISSHFVRTVRCWLSAYLLKKPKYF